MFSTTEAEEVLVSEESVKGSVGLASLAHEASEGNDGVLGTGHLAVFVNLKQVSIRFKNLPGQSRFARKRGPWR